MTGWDEMHSVTAFDLGAEMGTHYFPPSQSIRNLLHPQLPLLLVSVDFLVVLPMPFSKKYEH